jgi:hypothetical protein
MIRLDKWRDGAKGCTPSKDMCNSFRSMSGSNRFFIPMGGPRAHVKLVRTGDVNGFDPQISAESIVTAFPLCIGPHCCLGAGNRFAGCRAFRQICSAPRGGLWPQ